MILYIKRVQKIKTALIVRPVFKNTFIPNIQVKTSLNINKTIKEESTARNNFIASIKEECLIIPAKILNRIKNTT